MSKDERINIIFKSLILIFINNKIKTHNIYENAMNQIRRTFLGNKILIQSCVLIETIDCCNLYQCDISDTLLPDLTNLGFLIMKAYRLLELRIQKWGQIIK